MKFDPGVAATKNLAGSRTETGLNDNWLLPYLEKISPSALAELGTGTGTRAASLLEKFPALSYRGFEPGAAFSAATASRLQAWPGRARVETHALVEPLPLPDGSQHALLSLDLFEHLRMDQIYMMVSEARRILRPRGLWLIRSFSDQTGLLARFASRGLGGRPLDLNHYVSPEDWQVVLDLQLKSGWTVPMRQIFVLERL